MGLASGASPIGALLEPPDECFHLPSTFSGCLLLNSCFLLPPILMYFQMALIANVGLLQAGASRLAGLPAMAVPSKGKCHLTGLPWRKADKAKEQGSDLAERGDAATVLGQRS